MTRLFTAASVIGLLLPAIAHADTKEEEIQKDRQQIKGTWRIVSLVVNGDTAKEEDAKKLTVVNGDNGTWSLSLEGKEISKGISTIDPTKTPKTIDFRPTEGGGKDKLHLGIYEISENTRRLCFAPPEQERPAEFSSTPDNKHILVTFLADES